MPDGPSNPFERTDVVAGYETWYATPFGRLADELEYDLLLEMLAPLAPGASLLEIGCGTAHFGERLTRAGYRVTGADPAAAMLSLARTRLPVVRAAAERLPFADASFDGALVVAVLDFAEDPARVLAQARRVARGRVAVIGLCSTSWLALRRRISGRLGHPIFSTARFWSRGELLGFARAAGGTPERVRGALVLPPALAGRLPRLERSLSARAHPFAGLVAFSMRGGGT